MSSILKLSSLSKKYLMALAGLFLIIFLLVHLSINLCLLRNDNGEWFNAAAHFMGTNYVVKVFEVVLISTFILHILLGVILQLENWMSRPQKYYYSNKTKTSFFSKYMIYTGIVVGIFLGVHFMNFYFIKLGFIESDLMLANGEPDFYNIARQLFANPTYSVLYIVLISVLGFHLNHAFQAGFQSLGINHPVYTPLIKKISTIYTFIIVIGFSIIPLYFLLFV